MGFHIEDQNVGLDDLLKRIQTTDLVPSREGLLEGIEGRFGKLKDAGIKTLSDLRREMKSSQKLEALSGKSGVENDYLVLLRREVEGYFPRPSPLSDFGGLDSEMITKLAGKGIKNTAELLEAANNGEGIRVLAKETGLDVQQLGELADLCSLTRIQWTSPLAARMLLEAGIRSAKQLSEADAENLCSSLERVNAGGRFFKGKIGLRDVRRLVAAAAYVV